MLNLLKRSKGFVATAIVAAATFGNSAYAAVTTVIPDDLAASETVVTGDLATMGATLIVFSLTVLGFRKVLKITGG